MCARAHLGEGAGDGGGHDPAGAARPRVSARRVRARDDWGVAGERAGPTGGVEVMVAAMMAVVPAAAMVVVMTVEAAETTAAKWCGSGGRRGRAGGPGLIPDYVN